MKLEYMLVIISIDSIYICTLFRDYKNLQTWSYFIQIISCEEGKTKLSPVLGLNLW